jgi:hypothetical protein
MNVNSDNDEDDNDAPNRYDEWVQMLSPAARAWLLRKEDEPPRTISQPPGQTRLGENGQELAAALSRLADALESLGGADLLTTVANSAARLADHFAPAPGSLVGSEYVAQKLGCTTTWIAELARKGGLPQSCVVQGSGNGKLWKFHRARIDAWIAGR